MITTSSTGNGNDGSVALKKKTDPPRASARAESRDVDAVETHRACIQGKDATDAFEQGALAAAVRPENGQQLAAKHVEVDVV